MGLIDTLSESFDSAKQVKIKLTCAEAQQPTNSESTGEPWFRIVARLQGAEVNVDAWYATYVVRPQVSIQDLWLTVLP